MACENGATLQLKQMIDLPVVVSLFVVALPKVLGLGLS